MDALTLLRREANALFSPAGPARRAGRLLVVLSASNGIAAVPAAEVPAAICSDLLLTTSNPTPAADHATAPAVVRPSCEILARSFEDVGMLSSSGPSYLVTGHSRCITDAVIERSDDDGIARLFHANPSGWEPEPWRALVEGRLGPWAMAADGVEVLSICQTSLCTDLVAEAGTWTRPDCRGQGLAAATTASWASSVRATGRLCFYSTASTNRSSQAVARRLGWPLLGSLWGVGS